MLKQKTKILKTFQTKKSTIFLLEFVKEAAAPKPKNDSKRKVYYISAEFLIGKLLSNNLINLGIYKDVKAELAAAGKSISEVEDVEPEPSLGNGGFWVVWLHVSSTLWQHLASTVKVLGLTTTVVFSNKSSKITNKMQNQTTGLKINHGWYQLISLMMFHSKKLHIEITFGPLGYLGLQERN